MMLYSKNGSVPSQTKDDTEGWIEVEDPPIPPEGKEVVWWYPPGWVVRDPRPEPIEGFVWKWNQTEEVWKSYEITPYMIGISLYSESNSQITSNTSIFVPESSPSYIAETPVESSTVTQVDFEPISIPLTAEPATIEPITANITSPVSSTQEDVSLSFLDEITLSSNTESSNASSTMMNSTESSNGTTTFVNSTESSNGITMQMDSSNSSIYEP